MKKRKYVKSGVTAEMFVRIWQKSADMDAFIAETGMERKAASHRAAFYKERGIPLKHYPRGGQGREPLDVAGLTKIAKTTKPK